MKIRINKLRLNNFKGALSFEIYFFGTLTTVRGDNATGKTRLFDALLWLLFGKDSQGRSDFEVKPLKVDGTPVKNSEVEVEAVFDIDGHPLQLMKVYKEKWQKKRGEIESTLTGHESGYYIDRVNVKKWEYENYIHTNIASEEVFKLITNPGYFQSLKWADRRELLFKLVPEITDKQIIGENVEFAKLMEDLTGKTMARHKETIAARKKLIKADLEAIPTRIDEVQNSKGVKVEIDEVQKLILAKKGELKKVEGQIISEFKRKEEGNKKLIEKQNEIFALEEKKNQIEHNVKLKNQNSASEYKDKERILIVRVNTLIAENNNFKRDISICEEEIKKYEVKIEVLRKEWLEIEAREFVLNPNELICPTCKQPLKDVNELILQENFHKNRQLQLEEIESKGKELRQLMEKYIEELKNKNELLEKNMNELVMSNGELEAIKNTIVKQDEAVNLKEYQDLLKEIEEKKSVLTVPDVNTKELEESREAINNELAELSKQVQTYEQIERADTRIKELEGRMKEKAQQLADVEREEDVIKRFEAAKIEATEKAINAKFKHVQFKLFSELLNGEYEAACITLMNGIPYESANYAARVNSGLDIINTFSKIRNIYAPVFLDNKESITYPIRIETQMIYLVKDESYKELKIENQ
jgi:DNA repair exonuclease SbcCD ATPase subunit